ncbi:hypothetical protein GCM10027440_16910 [Nocardiopsis coralliicola]
MPREPPRRGSAVHPLRRRARAAALPPHRASVGRLPGMLHKICTFCTVLSAGQSLKSVPVRVPRRTGRTGRPGATKPPVGRPR